MSVPALSIGINDSMLNSDMGKRDAEQTMLGRWLREARGDRSQTEVAARIEMEQAEWSRWERGERKRPNPKQIEDFAFALGVSRESVALAYAGIWPGEGVTQALPPEVMMFFGIADLVERMDATVMAWVRDHYGDQAVASARESLDRARRPA